MSNSDPIYLDHIQFDAQKTATVVDVDVGNELLDAVRDHDLDQVKHICEKYPEMIDYRGFMGWSSAHWAARYGFIDILEYLLEQGADFHLKDLKGDTIMHKAAANAQFKTMQWLLRLGIDFNSRNHHVRETQHCIDPTNDLQ